MNKKYLIFIIIFFSLIIFVLSFFLFNNTYNIKKDFEKAFNYRLTGNCEEFLNYLYDSTHLYNNCINEKNRNLPGPIKNFTILNITISNGIAYLQVELTRKKTYIVNYQMKKINYVWKIKSENK